LIGKNLKLHKAMFRHGRILTGAVTRTKLKWRLLRSGKKRA
jgi:hypothetical protein